MASYPIAIFVDISESFDKRLIEAVIRSIMLHAQCHGHLLQPFELNEVRVLSHLLYLFAILNVYIRRLILFVMLHRKK